MARGNEAKTEVMEKIIECFGASRCFIYDKKLYINTKEGGEAIQVCLALTCPKTMVTPSGVAASVEPPKSAFGGGFDFESMGLEAPAPAAFQPAAITPGERETVADLMRRLGL